MARSVHCGVAEHHMKALALRRAPAQQLDLYERDSPTRRPRHVSPRAARPVAPLCARCKAKEARYGFRDEDLLEGSRTLCFECFRLEIVRRQERATQLQLPISETLNRIDRRRRRAQIAARRALGI